MFQTTMTINTNLKKDNVKKIYRKKSQKDGKIRTKRNQNKQYNIQFFQQAMKYEKP